MCLHRDTLLVNGQIQHLDQRFILSQFHSNSTAYRMISNFRANDGSLPLQLDRAYIFTFSLTPEYSWNHTIKYKSLTYAMNESAQLPSSRILIKSSFKKILIVHSNNKPIPKVCVSSSINIYLRGTYYVLVVFQLILLPTYR